METTKKLVYFGIRRGEPHEETTAGPDVKTLAPQFKYQWNNFLCVCVVFFFFFFFVISWAAPAAYGGSQARGLIEAVAAGNSYSHSNEGSQSSLQHNTTAHGNARSLTQ